MSDRVERPALRGTLLGNLLRFWNPVMKRLLRSPLHWPWSRWFAVIEWTGRKSGKTYRTPVSYVRTGDEVLITTGDAWWRNLEADPSVRLWVRGREHRARAVVVEDDEESITRHREMFAARPIFATLAGISRGREQDAQLRRSLEAGRKLVRVDLA